MAVCLVIEVPGGTLEQYDQVREGLGPQTLGEGQLHHFAGATDDGIMVVDIWESREQFDRFMQERVGEQLQKAGLPEPRITEFAVHASDSR